MSYFANPDNLKARAAAAQAAAIAELKKDAPCRTAACEQARASTGVMGWITGTAFSGASQSSPTGIFGILFFLAVAIFVVFLTLMFVHFTMYPIFSFSPNDAGFIPVPTASDQQLDFKNGPASYDLSANFTSLPACSYTLATDVYLSGNFMTSEVPRVILYRSNAPVTTGGTVDDLVSTYPYTNFIVWLDPLKNDLYMSVVTTGDGSSTRSVETTDPIENVPVRKTFRLSVVFTPQFVELYINGNLEKSMAIKGQLTTIPEESYIYPTIRPILSNVLVGNVSMYPRILTAREIRANEGGPVKTDTFFLKNV